MNVKQKVNSVGFQLVKISTEQFAILPECYDDKNPEVKFGIGLNFSLQKESRIISLAVKVLFEQNEAPFIVLAVANHFAIEQSAWDSFCKKDGNFVINKGFSTHLLVLTIGTLRGVLHCKTENTDFNKFVLPTINATELIREDVVL